MDTKQQIADRIKKANNILVTVSANPSVDQLAACIGLTLVCNKLGKHATAVFSGAVPSVIEFLQPEKTIEKNTDSLRDFIISLDKAKADKLRYKVEDKVVKIFITPYRTSISDKDLDFSQGDFNVDVILALGVHNQADLDQAIIAHGRILHDAAVVTLNVAPGGELGGTNWLDPGASSLSELAAELSDAIDSKLVDSQIATSFLTGIVAETKRFSNAKTSPKTMSISSELMALGANQQLVASKLEEPAPRPAAPVAGPLATQPAAAPAQAKPDDGTLEIQHADEKPKMPEPEVPSIPAAPATPQIHIDDEGEIRAPGSAPVPIATPISNVSPSTTTPELQHTEGPKLILEPPTFASELTANANSEDEEQPSGNPLTLPSAEAPAPLLNRTMLKSSEPTAPVIGRTIEPPAAEAKNDGGIFGPSVPVDAAPPATVMPQITPLTPPVSPTPAGAMPPVAPAIELPKPGDPAFGPAPTVPDLTTPTPAAPTMVSPSLPVPTSPSPSTLSPLNPFAVPSQVAPTPPAPVPWQPSVLSTPASVLPEPAAPAPGEQAQSVANARDAVAEAINASTTPPLEPIKALNAQDFGTGSLHDGDQASTTGMANDSPVVTPPPVPPPMMPLQ